VYFTKNFAERWLSGAVSLVAMDTLYGISSCMVKTVEKLLQQEINETMTFLKENKYESSCSYL
jgi:hypothetical protein